MANKLLQSIKFPGLSDTYVVPQIDDTLSVESRAADAKATGNRIDALHQELNNDYTKTFYTKNVSHNMVDGDSSLTSGYIAKNGVTSSSNSLAYTDFIPVESGEVLRAYYTNMGIFQQHGLRMVCCYDANKTAVSSAGTNDNVNTFLVPSGISFVRVTLNVGSTLSNHMITRDYEATEYEPYEETTYTIVGDFITDETKSKINQISEFVYGCAIPETRLLQTLGMPEKWYYSNAITPDIAHLSISSGNRNRLKMYNTYADFPNDGSQGTSTNGFIWGLYDEHLSKIKESVGSSGYGWACRFLTENLSDCSLLAIGDSTVDHDTMTRTLLSHFAEQEHTITLLGTLGDGTETNKNEGRAGWRALDYLTDRKYNNVTNPFYNPSTETFDFSYYMTNQGYSSPDFVVLQLGINDLYGVGMTTIESTWVALSTIIDSILDYDNSIKIILNLPTPPNTDQSLHSTFLPIYHKAVVLYNEYVLRNVKENYSRNSVRCSYCHLILDPNTEISDNVHPTSAGYAKMALEVINQINCWQNGV